MTLVVVKENCTCYMTSQMFLFDNMYVGINFDKGRTSFLAGFTTKHEQTLSFLRVLCQQCNFYKAPHKI